MKVLLVRSVMPAAALAAGLVYGVNPEAFAPSDYDKYTVVNLYTLGGTISRGNSINDAGVVAGYSNLAGNTARHATLWSNGTLVDLGTLGGPNSSVAWPVKNDAGLVVGISQTATPDPLGENWSCSAFFGGPNRTGYTCVGFAWQNGVMQALPTLGGNNAFAAGANNLGEIVGWAENTVHDPTCVAPQVLQFHAVVWEADTHQIRQLPTLPGDTSGAATAINDNGQVVGISGTCDQAVGRFTAAHAVLWENGGVTEIGDLGGTTWNTPMAINRHGDVVGFASLPGDDPDNPTLRAFLWTRDGGIQDLGTLPGHATAQANGINDDRQVVGTSCTAAGKCRAFIWRNGVMRNLRTLVDHGYTYDLESAQDINDEGEITGRALNLATGERPAFLATPSPRGK
jgi:probable HAF family extracellular repeat protein